MWSQENMKHEYEICAALNKEKHQVVNFLWQHLLKWIGQCVPRMTSDTSESSEVFRAVIICVFKRPLTSSFYWSSSSCWIKLVNHPANQVTDLKTAEQWGLLSQRKVSLSLWWGYLSCPAAPEWAQSPQGSLHCLSDRQEPLAPGHRAWKEEEDEGRGKANLQKYFCTF